MTLTGDLTYFTITTRASRPDFEAAQVVNDRLMEVPDYQRPYAWGRKQLADLAMSCRSSSGVRSKTGPSVVDRRRPGTPEDSFSSEAIFMRADPPRASDGGPCPRWYAVLPRPSDTPWVDEQR